MKWTYILIWGSWIIFGATTVWALAWAIGSGQFSQLQEGARSIFDEDEPIDEMTDLFPDVDREDLIDSTPERGGDRD